MNSPGAGSIGQTKLGAPGSAQNCRPDEMPTANAGALPVGPKYSAPRDPAGNPYGTNDASLPNNANGSG